ncbi:benzoate-CoA ligase family protein [Lutimaribacter marinistellae]|uniref:Benzoate-CoA ligase family protein n=1 Tax=Lutimaribacter marinistellae TaxID=1820329 RepID=A0ABV7TLL5_9RHOB
MGRLQSVDILGGGPAGLYTAILLRRRMPHLRLRLIEQNPRGATFGFGVVFSDQALGFLKADDPETHDLITPRMEQWQNMVLNHPGGAVTLDGIGFSAIGRLKLIELLTDRAHRLGVDMVFGQRVSDLEALGADLVVGADGLNSLVRRTMPEAFGERVDHFSNRFAWFGTPRTFDTLTQTFIETEAGPLNAHHYRYSPEASTFIVECNPETYRALGFAEMDEAQSAERCADLFSEVLEGAPLLTNKSQWRQFPRLWCDRWVNGRHVLLGDAAHTAHFSIGSGTRLAMEDAIALVSALERHADWGDALEAYQSERSPVAKKIVDAANTSAQWYETFGDRMRQSPLDFAFDYITRSGRVDMDRLRKMAPGFMAAYEERKPAIIDPVADDAPGAVEIDFDRSAHPNCSAVLWDNLERNPDKTALIGPGGTVTYAQLCRMAARWGNAFLAHGLERGERIAFFLDDSPIFVAAFFGAVRAGFVPVLLNIQTGTETLAYFLRDSGARVALCEAGLADRFAAQAVETLVGVNGTALGCRDSADFLSGQPEDLPCADTGPDDMAFWMYSSGSTGKPKGIVHLHHDMAYTHESFGHHVLRLRPDDVCFSVPKIYFAYGFGNAITFPFSIGATTLLMPGQPSPAGVFDLIEAYRPTVFFGLPTLYTALAHSEGAGARDLSSLRQSMSAAEILSEEIHLAWKRLAGHGPTEGLGSTEMLHVYLSNRVGDHRYGAAGAPVPGYEVRLLSPDGDVVPPGEEGVMEVRGHSSAPCYWNRPDKTAETMRGDWIHTGDRFVERDGYFYFQGRADDLIKVSGQWVWPLEVERCLNEHPEVRECAVLAHQLPDRRMTLRAVVALRGEKGRETTRELQDFVKHRLQPFKYPRLVEFVAELPKTGTGKIDRQALRQTGS